MSSPLLRAEGLRVAVDGATKLDGVDFESRGEHVVVHGDQSALVAAIAGARRGHEGGAPPDAHVAAGKLYCAGRDVARREHFAVCGVAPFDPPMPWDWTAEEYLAWGCRLSGTGRGSAAARAAATLQRLHLAGHRLRRLAELDRVARRVLTVALAVVGDPAVAVLDDPLSGLDGAEQSFVARVVRQAIEGRGAVLALGSLEAGTPGFELARGASDVLLFRDQGLLCQLAGAELGSRSPGYELTVTRNAEALSRGLEEHGAVLRGGPRRFILTLGSHATPTTVLEVAAKVGAPVVDLVPLFDTGRVSGVMPYAGNT